MLASLEFVIVIDLSCESSGTSEGDDCLDAAVIGDDGTAEVTVKRNSGIATSVIGRLEILTDRHIDQLEAALPRTHQCYDWKLVYR
jgi:hypothetical protein